MNTFSVLMSVYSKDNPVWLDQSLDSILVNQTVLPSQVVLIVDGPISVDLKKCIEKYKILFPSILDVHIVDNNIGLGGVLNLGLEICRNELVARMDADDISLQDRFETQLEYFDQVPEIDILGTYSIEIDEEGKDLGIRTVPCGHKEIYRSMWACPVIHPTVMFKKSVIQSVGSYSEKLKRRQDYHLWFRCAKQGAIFANLPVETLKYRVTKNSPKKNGIGVAWTQTKIGLQGVAMLSLGWKAYVGVLYPTLAKCLPAFLRNSLTRIARNFDPRKQGK